MSPSSRERGASTAAKRRRPRSGHPMGRSIEDRSVRLLGFLSVHSRLRSAHSGVRLFRRGHVLPWAFASLRFHGCDRCCSGHERTAPNGPSRSTVRPAADLPRAESAHGFASDVSRPRDEFGKQYQSRRSPMCGAGASTVRFRETRRARPPWKRSLTSLQRIEATDALPILARFLF